MTVARSTRKPGIAKKVLREGLTLYRSSIGELVYLPIKTDYTRIEKTAYSFYVRRLADGGQEKGSRERTVMLPDGYHKRYTKQISGYEPIRAVGAPINPMKA